MKKKLISIVIPIYNEEKNVPEIYNALKDVWKNLVKYNYEIIYVNDGSSDDSSAAVLKLAANDKKVKYIEFSRNFGKEMATTAGLHEASGDAVIMIDADLQHSPEMIPHFIERWERGAEVVVGVRTANLGQSLSKKGGSWLFYKIMQTISETPIQQGETDFRLMDRTVVDAFNTFAEKRRMTRSLINWLGYTKEIIEFEAPARLHGDAQYSTGKLFRLGIYSFVSNSLLPLRLAGYLGLIITIVSGALGTVVFVNRYIFDDALGLAVSGSGQLAILNAFLIGIVLMALGIIALYIENIHVEITRRPLYVVRKRKNID
jgi:polyisoprenyl-phosphate glycosyltransferase